METTRIFHYTDKEAAQPRLRAMQQAGYDIVEEGPIDPEKNAGASYKIVYQLNAPRQTVALLESINSKLNFFVILTIVSIIFTAIGLLFR